VDSKLDVDARPARGSEDERIPAREAQPHDPSEWDASLIRELLALTPLERLAHHERARHRVVRLRAAFERRHGR
jgi:hypothetical protein